MTFSYDTLTRPLRLSRSSRSSSGSTADAAWATNDMRTLAELGRRYRELLFAVPSRRERAARTAEIGRVMRDRTKIIERLTSDGFFAPPFRIEPSLTDKGRTVAYPDGLDDQSFRLGFGPV